MWLNKELKNKLRRNMSKGRTGNNGVVKAK